MIRWLIAVFLALVLINGLTPWLKRLGLGRLPGDFSFRLLGRDWFIPQLQAAGLRVPVMPDGAFYAWADCTALAERLGISSADTSWDFAFELMQRAHLAITPGRDFGTAETGRFVRFSTASSMAHLEEAAARLKALAG